ncbi:glycoside hydrolase family 30 protein [Paenibacillus sp. FSL R7-0331]|uniref:glycoside hydrolase family 30 protein n=1 Tax=Paenibacillus sp. FSL R7-0331 TaxID=1536773 RepID=UPI0004F6069E|nr:glycoside hydrolase family 30 protein [Paenibacillus sp. FSL R7-0331]AIQ50426.1 glucosylceramidase [Paenibacillus sp. FSL R7-0331]
MVTVQTVLTAKETGERLSRREALVFGQKDSGQTADIQLQPEQEFQSIIGFGGAFTEAAAYTLSRMSPARRAEVIRSYFHPEEGLGYSMGRVHIHSCDFALGNYTYVQDQDTELATFDITHDHQWVLPLIKDAMEVKGGPFTMLASPWSPPAWMKTNGEMNNGGSLKPEYAAVWARYYTKFIEAYRNEGIPVWAVSVQNEPAAVQTWDSCVYSAEEERDFVKNHLGPALHEAGMDDVNIVIWDHNRDIMIERVTPILSDPEAAKYVWGTGIHWYGGEEFDKVAKVHELFPDKHVLFTEGCQEGGVRLGEWFTGERYGRNMIGDLNAWTEGYLDWNLVLDETGGPNHVGNFCDAPIIADTVTDELHYNSSYYYIGHFSKYIAPGAVRIGLESAIDGILSTAFRNPDGSIAVVLMNESDEARSVTLGLGSELAVCQLPPHSIATHVIS